MICQSVYRRSPCRHCSLLRVVKRRGLCHRCYYTKAIRRLYSDNRKRGAGSVGNDWVRPTPLPDEPTDALPGTEAKVEVMRARFAERQSLWHPEDARGQ